MKILHITYTTSGGAGIAVLRLHNALLSQGIESKILVGQTDIVSNDITKITETNQNHYVVPNIPFFKQVVRFLRRKGRCLTMMEKMEFERTKLDRTFAAGFDLPLSAYEIEKHPLIDWADIINIHWISDFVNFPTFFKMGKPIVWTMHDYYPFMGGFHYTGLRDKYKTLFSSLEQRCYDIKKDSLAQNKNLSIVALSSILEREISKHEFYKGRAIFKIHNSVDPALFRLYDKYLIREILQWPTESKVLLFVNKNMNFSEKGLIELTDAINLIEDTEITLVCVGDGQVPTVNNRHRLIHYDSVSNIVWLNMLYSAADFLVQPAHQEAFAQTPIEAMCCGTPVIMTPVSGADDLINKDNGIIAEGFSPAEIAKAIELVIGREYNRSMIREYIVSNFSPERIAKQYIEAYKKILSASNGCSAAF